MNGIYLIGLLLGITGVTVLDLRYRLFLGAEPLRAAAVLVVGVAGFLVWDTAGIHLGIFFEGNPALITGVQLGPQLPLEELFFLVLLCLTTMNLFLAASRRLGGRRIRQARTGPPARTGRPQSGARPSVGADRTAP